MYTALFASEEDTPPLWQWTIYAVATGEIVAQTMDSQLAVRLLAVPALVIRTTKAAEGKVAA